MKNLAISLLTAGVLALPGAVTLADDDDDDGGRRGRWHERVERGYWYAPRVHPRHFDDWYSRGPRYYYYDHEPFGYPGWHPNLPPTWDSPWYYDQWRGGYWRSYPHETYHFRQGRSWHWRHGDDDDDDDDD